MYIFSHSSLQQAKAWLGLRDGPTNQINYNKWGCECNYSWESYAARTKAAISYPSPRESIVRKERGAWKECEEVYMRQVAFKSGCELNSLGSLLCLGHLLGSMTTEHPRLCSSASLFHIFILYTKVMC